MEGYCEAQNNKTAASRTIVVAGGNGFIGSHVAKYFHDQGFRVRVVDIQASSMHEDGPFYTDCLIGNLCDLNFCKHVVRGADTVLHFAAVMGGMGVIHSQNDDIIYRANHSMTQNLLQASSQAGVSTFFYASSACVYPVHIQTAGTSSDIQLREDDVYAGLHPDPQHLYGLEKLNSEHLVRHYSSRMQIRIGRFHNVYGPRCSWNDGREKVPAAFIRKAIAAKLLADTYERPEFEIWGDGNQRRSFLYIEDAVRAVARMLEVEGETPPLNIGSDQSVSILDLAELSLRTVGMDLSDVTVTYKDCPVGVANRNSNNELASRLLSWTPSVSYHDGLYRTQVWIMARIQDVLLRQDPATREEDLRSLSSSSVVDLNAEAVKFAIILPVTSRPDPEKCYRNLVAFACSLSNTTWRDRTELCTTHFEPHIYLVIDYDDHYLLGPQSHMEGRAESILRLHGLGNITTIVSHRPKGHVCALWRDAALRAFQNGCDYYILMGDDVELLDEGWMRAIHSRFQEIAKESGGPPGFGCVAFTDVTFPGMPTFPVVHRTHMKIFKGQVIPEDFVNQDGDPYLFQLYRHFGASVTVPARLHNVIGGTDNARYEKQPLLNWTFETLETGKETVRAWAKLHAPQVQPRLSLDVIVPSYRVDLNRLSKILSLQPSATCITMFIVIIDDPTSPFIHQLEHNSAHRMDVRIRVNKSNRGASASRNRGLAESSAEWVAFLDDDIDPSSTYLVDAERYIRQHPDAAGFVGNAYFPVAHNIFTAAVHLAGVTFFWDIANKINEDVPWGVTANLIVRRNVRDNVMFDLIFPKTGGGEDIDFCRKKRQASLKRGGTAFWAAPDASVTHPWWNNGSRSYWRFYMWAKGDGALIKLYPEYSWRDTTPSSAEIFAFAVLVVIGGIISGAGCIVRFGFIISIVTFFVNILHDAYRHLVRHKERTKAIQTTIGSVPWVLAVIEGGLIRMASEMGRLVGVVERREWSSLGKRFDWFTGGPWGITEERNNGIEKTTWIILVCALVLHCM